MVRTLSIRSLVLAAAFTLAPVAAFAGPLTPPGSPAPTMKTLAQVEPRIPINATNTPGDSTCVYRITQPGSYYLTDNFSVGPSISGIVIDSNDVTLDLSGFAITHLTDNDGVAPIFAW